MIKILNTISGKKEEFTPMDDKKVRMFVCGPTVYDYIHIGNARTFVFFDAFAKYLKHKGYDVTYIQNITDIDDKIIKRAHDEGATPQDIATKYTQAFLKNMKKLDVKPTKNAKASKYVREIKNQIQKLIKRGYAYPVPALEAPGLGAVKGGGFQDVYFDIEKYEKDFPGQYGKLSGQVIENLEAAKRVEMEKNKRHPRDFVLWKAQNYSYDWTTNSPWGKGRPGWHIEDTAISEHFFGPQYDIHGGGQDLKFPHHEAEIAQQQAASGKVPFVNYWMHVAFLENQQRKMSKSLGNFETLHNLLPKHTKNVIRHYLLAFAHYRTPLSFSTDSLGMARSGVENMKTAFSKVNDVFRSGGGVGVHGFETKLENYKNEFYKALDDDFNVPMAFGLISGLFSDLYQNSSSMNLSQITAAYSFLNEVNKIFGSIPIDSGVPKTILKLGKNIDKLRKKGDYQKSDGIRLNLEGKGFHVMNTKEGTIIIAPEKPASKY
ncbi:MAG TPA: cysteine--tRNA ligase [Candidatus Paceibacterota bacterium]|nr:cysteine--tRNA ligase [Candidatus Paceibacterota bacterium]